MHFNSHAHVERDRKSAYMPESIPWFQLTRSRGAWLCVIFIQYALWIISTHTLTWSVTYKEGGFTMAHMISTHTLTWSVTAATAVAPFDVWFQLTRSRGAWQLLILSMVFLAYFNSHAHVERDQSFLFFCRLLPIISTHTLTWSVTYRKFQNQSQNQFQLTRSRGAWRKRMRRARLILQFQLTRSR